MQIKRFEARDMTSALRLIKNELGPEAVILSARSLKKESKILGLVKSAGVEVTAAVDSYSLPAELNKAAITGALSAYRRHAQGRRPQPEKFNRTAGRRIKTFNDRSATRRRAIDAPIAAKGVLDNVFEHLLSQEVRRDLAADIVVGLSNPDGHHRFDSTEQIISKVAQLLQAGGKRAKIPYALQSKRRVVAVVGPTGVGKTTTVAKLAARHAFQQRQAVALICLDSRRIAAAVELKIYARAIGIPLKTSATPSAFKSALDELREFDLVLVDTPGINPANTEEIDALKTCLDGIDALEIHLVLSATAKASDLSNTFKRLNTLAFAGLIFTKLDESCTYGNLINLLDEHPVPLSYLTNGRQVPDAIETGSLEKMAQLLLGDLNISGGVSTRTPQDQPVTKTEDRSSGLKFVANKNSDVFHCPDCKWARKIKPKNLITFSSVKTAKRQHFMACKDCQPDLNQAFQNSRDSVRISNYS